ncbi:unnamed protein product [Heterobilharzia americana]|nr:unnamed protein product [Heterobilharzia americana]CAH8669426.1 unnamed protein product [Heterobilharzia americana]
MASMSKRDTEQFKKIFKYLDKNNDGVVSYQELRSEMMSQGVAEKLIKEVMDSLDLNKDNKVTFEEFLEAVKKNVCK